MHNERGSHAPSRRSVCTISAVHVHRFRRRIQLCLPRVHISPIVMQYAQYFRLNPGIKTGYLKPINFISGVIAIRKPTLFRLHHTTFTQKEPENHHFGASQALKTLIVYWGWIRFQMSLDRRIPGRMDSCESACQEVYAVKTARFCNCFGCDWDKQFLLRHRSNFCSKVILLLLDALALFIANILGQLDLAAQLLGNRSNVLLNRSLAVLNKDLLQ